jgi:hypothetical protein
MISFCYNNDNYVTDDMTNSKVSFVYTVDNNDATLTAVIQHFEQFLKCVGYNLDGKMVEVVEK